MKQVTKKIFTFVTVQVVIIMALSTMNANAHNLTMWPSKFSVNSDKPTVVTVDLTRGDLAYRLDHAVSPMGFSALDPQGKSIRRTGNLYQSAERTTIDFPITQQGTYTLKYDSAPRYNTSYAAGKKAKRKRLRLDKIAAQKELPNSAKNVMTKKSITSAVAFVTNTLPSEDGFKTTAKGIEITPVTHPSDYVTEETIAMLVTYNGKPLTNNEVSLTRDGAQYTANSTPTKSMTDKNGELNFMFQQGGRYVLTINHSVKESTDLYDELSHRLYYAFEVVYE